MKQSYKRLYKQIWEERKCEDHQGWEFVQCMDCPQRIYKDQLTVHNFAHIKSKGAEPSLKYNP